MNKLKAVFQFVIFLSFVLVNTGCQNFPFAHKLDIKQGHDLTDEKISKIEVGMLEEQVEFLLGSPLLKDAFHTQRWDYIYYSKPSKENSAEKKHLAIYFDSGRVTHVTRDALAQTTA